MREREMKKMKKMELMPERRKRKDRMRRNNSRDLSGTREADGADEGGESWAFENWMLASQERDATEERDDKEKER